MAERWVITTRYVRPADRRVIRHVYVADDNQPFATRARALGAIRRMLRDDRNTGHDVDAAIVDGSLEIYPVRIVEPEL